ncbi:MAG: hypothetical protein QOF48_3481 [Verrucomicrobiota bacterium]|jgi:hypothetical protein
MKSAYELAMERLNKQSPGLNLTSAQKKEIAELESRYKAKVAERELGMNDAIQAALATGDIEETTKLQQRLAHEKAKLAEDLEEKKEALRKKKR